MVFVVQQKAFRWGIWHPAVMQFYSGPLIHFLSGVDSLGLGERKCPIDHWAQAMQRDRPVHRLKIRAAPDADRAEGNAAAGQQERIEPRPRRRQACTNEADVSAYC